MALGAPSAPQELAESPLNFVYACSVCCATFADAYEGHNETVQGLSDGINPKDRLVTKLYLSNCCHVFCGEHIEGGGPPFHPAGQKPKVPCPICVKEKGDSTARELYSIRGFHRDEYDPAIPPIWFKAPPIDLSGNTKETEALRFQYLALVRYCQTSYRTRKPLSKALANTKQELSTMQNRFANEHSTVVRLQYENEKLRASVQQMGDVEALRADIQRLQHLEQETDQFNADLTAFRRLKADVRDLDVFRQHQSAILHYLKLVPTLIKQNEKMRERLASLGFAMALEPIPNHPQLTSDDLDEIASIAGAYSEDRRFQKSASTHTAGRSAHTTGNGAVAHPFTSSGRPLKRQRIDSPLPQNMHIDPPSSRDAMLPPSKLLSRMRSVRGLIPTLRKKFSNTRAPPKEHRKHNGDVQMYDTEHWQGRGSSLVDDNTSSPSYEARNETPYMTGALPVEQASQGPNRFFSAGPHMNASDFTFRTSSPVKMDVEQNSHQPVQLPTGPSYLHLIDGLSRDNGVDLGLKDPRLNASGRHETNNAVEQSVTTPQGQRETQETNPQQRRRLGHAFFHPSPNGPPKLANFSRAKYDQSMGNSTPIPSQQPVRQLDNVVSPFFGRSHYDAPTLPQSRITETKTSPTRFGVYQSQRYPTSQQTSAEWRELRSLNGLSFIDSPLDSRNQPIMREGHYQPPRHVATQSDQSHETHSHGFIRRRDIQRPLYNEDSGYGSSMHDKPTFSRQQQVQLQPVIHFPSFHRASSSRVGQLPSAMPSTISSHSLVRSRTQWEALQRAGVKSSRQTYGNVWGNTVNATSTGRPSHTKRRSVKR